MFVHMLQSKPRSNYTVGLKQTYVTLNQRFSIHTLSLSAEISPHPWINHQVHRVFFKTHSNHVEQKLSTFSCKSLRLMFNSTERRYKHTPVDATCKKISSKDLAYVLIKWTYLEIE